MFASVPHLLLDVPLPRLTGPRAQDVHPFLHLGSAGMKARENREINDPAFPNALMLCSAERPAFSFFFFFFSYPVAQTDKGPQRGRMRVGDWSGRGSTHRPRNRGICSSDLMKEEGPPTDPQTKE